MSSDEDAWKIFNRDNEAGRLLSRLYGVKSPGGVACPPVQRRRRTRATDGRETRDLPAGRSWKTTYAVHGWSKAAEEEREQERKENISRALSLAVPKVGRAGQRHSVHGASNSNICHVPRRTTEIACRKKQEETREKTLHYRPSATTKYYELDKRRLQSGGKGRCLPEDLTSIPCNRKSDVKSNAAPTPSTLFDQIHQEILDRRQHQMAMEEVGAGEATRESTARAIKERMERLKQLDSKRAYSLVRKMRKS